MNDKQQLAAMGEHVAEQAGQAQPLCMAKRIEELEEQVRALTTPEGWQLVPVEPTMEMLRAAVSREGLDPQHYGRIRDTYRAMLAAAPKLDAAK